MSTTKVMKVNGVEITLSAIENQTNSEYTLMGVYNSSSSINQFNFKMANDPNKPKYNNMAIEIVPEPDGSSPIIMKHSGHPSDLWVWTTLPKTVGDIIDTPRGTEVIVTGGGDQ